MKTLLGIIVFFNTIYGILAAYKYEPTVDLTKAYGDEFWAGVIRPLEWPYDTFVLVGNGPNKNPLDMVPITFWIVYKGNDTNRPYISQMRIKPGENIHVIMESFCDEAGFIDGPDSLACRGVELKGHVSEVIYGRCYTTTRPSATIDDFVASRTTVITWLIFKYQYQRYLEIGCDQGITFATIQV